MTAPVSSARKRHGLAKPGLDPFVLGLIDIVGPVYARLALRMESFSFIQGERFVESLRDFYQGRSRLILAFRHPYGDEPQILTWAMHRGVAREIGRLGLSELGAKPHCLFLHGYEVPLWSGPLVRWILPRSGAMPVYHVRMDGSGLRTIRKALREGAHPLALAPEGQSSYRSETVPRVEMGTFQLGFWCAEELEAAGREEKVIVLPLTVHERHGDSNLHILEAACAKLEASLGLRPRGGREGIEGASPDAGTSRRRALGLRLRDLDEALIGAAEAYYGIRGNSDAPPSAGSPDDDAERIASRERRREALLEEALRRGEAMLGLRPEGDSINRVYRLRHEGWARIYPETDPASLHPRERAYADRRAGEAWYAMRHMELVDLGWYLDAAYLEDGLRDGKAPSVGRLSETLHNLYDFASRLAGGNISDRPRLLRRDLVLAAGEPLELRSRLPDYRADRRRALDEASKDLVAAWNRSIKEFTHVQ